jgi:steroid delta-isomerase-like uncharacterized protein
MSGNNLTLIHRWFDEVWNRGRLETIHELMAPEFVGIGQSGPGEVIRGPREFQAFVEKLRGAFPDIHVTIEDAFEGGGRVAARWSATMTHNGDHLGLPATGKQIRITGISIGRIVDGKIVEGWDNWDQLSMMRDVGAMTESKVAQRAAGL